MTSSINFSSLCDSVIDIVNNQEKLIEQNKSSEITELEKNVYQSFLKNTEQLISQIIAGNQYYINTFHDLRFALTLLKDKEYCTTFQKSLDSINTIGELLKDGKFQELDTFTKKIPNSEFPDAPTLHFHNLALPQDIKKIRSIPDAEVRYRIMAQLISRDNVPLTKLALSRLEFEEVMGHITFLDLRGQLSPGFSPLDSINNFFNFDPHRALILRPPPTENLKTLILPDQLPSIEEVRDIENPIVRIHVLAELINKQQIPLNKIKEIFKFDVMPKYYPEKYFSPEISLFASLLTYVDCRNFFTNWPLDDIEKFLECCSPQAKTLFVNVPEITKLPAFPNCRQFDCSGCTSLLKLPSIPKCEKPVCFDCLGLESSSLSNINEFQLYIEKIRAIPNSRLHMPLMANLINEHRIPLKVLNLTKEELNNLAYCLTFCDCRDAFNNWTPYEIQQFIYKLTQVEILYVNSPTLMNLPSFMPCIELDCSGCTSLNKLPSMPNCKKLLWNDCVSLQKAYLNLSPEIVIKYLNCKLPEDIEQIRRISNEHVRTRVMAFLINHDKKIALTSLNLSVRELKSLAPYLAFLDYRGIFDGWQISDIKEFLISCSPQIRRIPQMSDEQILNYYKKNLEESIQEYIFTYLDKTKKDLPLERLATFQRYLDQNKSNLKIKQLKNLTEIILIELHLNLPNVSLFKLRQRLDDLKANLTDQSIIPRIENAEKVFNKILEAASLEIENYISNTLEEGIRKGSVSKNVFFQLLKASIFRINYLKQSGLDEKKIEQLLKQTQYLENLIMNMAPPLPFDSSLKEASKQEKINKSASELDARLLIHEQATRIPEKLQRQLSTIQSNLDVIDYTDAEMRSSIAQRRSSNIEMQVLDESMLKKGVTKEISEGLGKVGLAHIKGDRPTQEDAHIATVLNLTLDDKPYLIPIYGIFDGHGGADGAKFLAKNLEITLKNELEKAFKSEKILNVNQKEAIIFNVLKTLFHKLTNQYRKLYNVQGGSTACIALCIDNKLWVSNLGDSRAILSVNGLPIALSQDANLDTPEQQRTVTKRGGRISSGKDKRVNDIINMSRSACEKSYLPVNTRPKIVAFPLELLPPGPKMLCIACDGVFDVLSSNSVSRDLFTYFENENSSDLIARNLVTTAYEKGSSDNISSVIVEF